MCLPTRKKGQGVLIMAVRYPCFLLLEQGEPALVTEGE
jgi:hypothetical protein